MIIKLLQSHLMQANLKKKNHLYKDISEKLWIKGRQNLHLFLKTSVTLD